MPDGKVPAYVARSFRDGYEFMLSVPQARPPRGGVEPQRDLVKKLQVGVRLGLMRALREHARGHAHRAIEIADQAGQWFGEYRFHSRHLRSLAGYRPTAIYSGARR